MARVVYETHKIEDLQLPFIFHKDKVTKRENSSNWHENIEILCFIKGDGALNIDGNLFNISAGDVAVINAECLHSVSSEDSISYYCLIIDNKFFLDNGINVSELQFSELISDSVLFGNICGVSQKMIDIKQGVLSLTSVPSVRYDILGIIIYLCDKYLLQGVTNKKDQSYNAIKEIIRYIRQTTGRVSLDEIAEYAQMSKYHMSREFKKVTGTTIFEYLNLFRCERAKRMLYNGATVSEAAAGVGFDNMSYFSRTFKRYIGKLPSECQKHKRKK